MSTPYLSYSGRKTYITCPRKYQYQYIDKPKVQSDQRSAMFGIIIGKVFEWFYNKKFWSYPNPTEKCIESVEDAIEAACHSEHFDRSIYPDFIQSLRDGLREFVPSTVQTIREHRLLTDSSRSEVDLTVNYTSKKHGMSLRIGGRADFVHGSDNIWIVDGKGSVHREKFIDAEQLIWYATQHYLKYHVAPSRLGFLYYRFPKDPVQWILYDEAAMRASINKTFDTAILISKGEFEPTPSKECTVCKYSRICSEGMKHAAAIKMENGGRIETSIFSLENVT